MYKVKYNGEEIEYVLTKSKRKTVGIKITNDGEVMVSAPLRASDKAVEGIVLKKAKWIMEKLKVVKENQNKIKSKEFINGRTISLLGKEYELSLEEAVIRGASVKFNGSIFLVRVNSSLTAEGKQQFIKDVLTLWMRKKAKEVFEERTKQYANMLKLYPKRITIKEQKTLWGSCSSKDNINFNWRLILAPIEVLDYVVVHELCHLKHRNHSKDYWDFVEGAMPDYEERRQWLKDNSNRLLL